MSLAATLLAAWYAPRLKLWLWPFVPGALAFRFLAAMRRGAYRRGLLRSTRLPVPVCVVGNLSVGGTGKTPLVIALAEALVQRGWRPGLITRGYRSAKVAPRVVTPASAPIEVGDEALLLARTGLPVWVGVDRAAVARALLAAHPHCDVIISDDGLQHYRLARDLELVVVDTARGWGNGWLLPAGPLREPRQRAEEAYAVIWNESPGAAAPANARWRMHLIAQDFVQLVSPANRCGAGDFSGKRTVAVAGIGHPERFFATLATLGIKAEVYPFPDHHFFTARDLAFPEADLILLTAKDAVKCQGLADPRIWVLPVRASLPEELLNQIEEKLSGCKTA